VLNVADDGIDGRRSAGWTSRRANRGGVIEVPGTSEPARSGRPTIPQSTPGGRLWSSQEECTLATATANATKLRPLGDRVVIKPTAREEMTKSGIVLPDTVKEKPQEGTIIAAGPGKVLDDGKREPMDVKTGDKVLYAKYAGTEFKIDEDELLIVSQKDILAIVQD
jgi:chaperonin GroES